jgi:hypothetical protein
MLTIIQRPRGKRIYIKGRKFFWGAEKNSDSNNYINIIYNKVYKKFFKMFTSLCKKK